MAAEIAGQGRVTLGADKSYDQKELVRALREYRVTPHVAQKVNSAIDRRSTRDPGYLLSQRRRKRVEEIFGWLKTVAGLRKTRHRGIARVGWTFTFAAAAYDLGAKSLQQEIARAARCRARHQLCGRTKTLARNRGQPLTGTAASVHTCHRHRPPGL